LDTLGIQKANLIGWSMGGNEITAMGADHPDRVAKLVYFDSYDTADPQFRAAFESIPVSLLGTPPGALDSMSSYRTYEKAIDFPSLRNSSPVEAYLRENVVVQPNGHLELQMKPDVAAQYLQSLWANPLRRYNAVHVPALAIYARSVFEPEVGDASRRRDARAWQRKYWRPLQTESIKRMREELVGVQIIRVPGTHVNFFLAHKGRVVSLVRAFLNGSERQQQPTDGGSVSGSQQLNRGKVPLQMKAASRDSSTF
jgi:pimeloyl-ACP methyl ester carboxylesterase